MGFSLDELCCRFTESRRTGVLGRGIPDGVFGRGSRDKDEGVEGRGLVGLSGSVLRETSEEEDVVESLSEGTRLADPGSPTEVISAGLTGDCGKVLLCLSAGTVTESELSVVDKFTVDFARRGLAGGLLRDECRPESVRLQTVLAQGDLDRSFFSCCLGDSVLLDDASALGTERAVLSKLLNSDKVIVLMRSILMSPAVSMSLEFGPVPGDTGAELTILPGTFSVKPGGLQK